MIQIRYASGFLTDAHYCVTIAPQHFFVPSHQGPAAPARYARHRMRPPGGYDGAPAVDCFVAHRRAVDNRQADAKTTHRFRCVCPTGLTRFACPSLIFLPLKQHARYCVTASGVLTPFLAEPKLKNPHAVRPHPPAEEASAGRPRGGGGRARAPSSAAQAALIRTHWWLWQSCFLLHASYPQPPAGKKKVKRR
jgi:hypothetical protein